MSCNTFVHADEEPCAREKSIYADKKLKSRISVISLCDFINTLGIVTDDDKKAAAAFSLDNVITLPPVAYGKSIKLTIKDAAENKSDKEAKPKRKRRTRKKKPSAVKDSAKPNDNGAE